MSNIVITEAAELQTIEPSKAAKIQKTFEPMVDMLQGFEQAYSELIKDSEKGIDQELTARAKRLRLDISRVRIESDKLRKSEKEEYLRAGKAIDGVNNILKWAVTERENKLKEIEDYFEIKEQKRLEALQLQRVEALEKYVEDAEERDLSAMEDDVWEAYFNAKKQAYEDRIEAEKKAEQERLEAERKENLRRERSDIIKPYYDFFNEEIKLAELPKAEFDKLVKELKGKKEAHLAEQEKIRKENERLQKEREEAEREAEAERNRLVKIENEKKQKETKEKEQILLSNGFELSNNEYTPNSSDKNHVITKKELSEIRFTELVERVDNIKAKEIEATERQAQEEAIKVQKQAEAAPVQKRLNRWVDSFALPELAGENHEVCERVEEKFNAFKKWAKAEIEKELLEEA